MGKLNLDELKVGMKLAAPVTDPSGRLLLPAGNEITEKHLRIFKAWGVTEADVVGIDRAQVTARELAQADPVKLRESESAVTGIFKYVDRSHPAMVELMRLCTLRNLKKKGPDG